MTATRGVALALVGIALAGCPAQEPAKIGATPLVQADGIVDATAPGATLEVTPTTVDAITMPAEAVVRLAVDRAVPWAKIEQLVATIAGNGKRPVMLVGRRGEVGAIELGESIGERHISVLAFVGGKACVRGPGVEAAKCVHSPDHPWVEKAFVRQLVREAREAFTLDDVSIELEPGLPWGDVVNAVDGARTCCGDDVRMRVAARTAVDDGRVLVPIDE